MSELTVLVIVGVFVLSLVWYGIGFLDGYRRGIKAGRRLENAELLSLGRRSEVHRPLSYDLVDDSMPAVSEVPDDHDGRFPLVDLPADEIQPLIQPDPPSGRPHVASRTGDLCWCGQRHTLPFYDDAL